MEDIQNKQTLFEDFKNKFEKEVAPSLLKFKSKLGSFLIKARNSLNDVYFNALQRWIKDKYNISFSAQNVAIRISDGEITEELANLIPASIAEKISVDNLPVPDKEYLIYSPSTGSTIRKLFKNFTPAERKINLGVHGIKSLDTVKPSSKFKPFDKAIASEYRVVGKDLILVVNSLSKEIYLTMTDKFVKDVSDTLIVRKKA